MIQITVSYLSLNTLWSGFLVRIRRLVQTSRIRPCTVMALRAYQLSSRRWYGPLFYDLEIISFSFLGLFILWITFNLLFSYAYKHFFANKWFLRLAFVVLDVGVYALNMFVWLLALDTLRLVPNLRLLVKQDFIVSLLNWVFIGAICFLYFLLTKNLLLSLFSLLSEVPFELDQVRLCDCFRELKDAISISYLFYFCFMNIITVLSHTSIISTD